MFCESCLIFGISILPKFPSDWTRKWDRGRIDLWLRSLSTFLSQGLVEREEMVLGWGLWDVILPVSLLSLSWVASSSPSRIRRLDTPSWTKSPGQGGALIGVRIHQSNKRPRFVGEVPECITFATPMTTCPSVPLESNPSADPQVCCTERAVPGERKLGGHDQSRVSSSTRVFRPLRSRSLG